MIPEEASEQFRAYASGLPSVQISQRSACDLELLSVGAFSPLSRFMGANDYERCVEELRLAGGSLFPIPLTLPVAADMPLSLDRDIALRDQQNDLLAVMTVEEIYEWDYGRECQRVLGTHDPRHPLVAEMAKWGRRYISGRMQVLGLPRRHDFQELRLSPAGTRARLDTLGRADVVAFQTRNPLHRAHEELTKRAAAEVGGTLLIHPAVGLTKPGDVGHYTRVRTYKTLVSKYYDPSRTLLALLPLAMRMAGPREALWHAIIRRNYGANNFIVGRDHASPGLDSSGAPFYGPYDAQELLEGHAEEIGVGVKSYGEFVYLPDEGRYEEVSKVPAGVRSASLSGTEVREQYLDAGRRMPEWFTRPEVADILAESQPPRHRQGACVWFTGLSGAGKSTTAELLTGLLLEHGRQVTVLDGDVVRTHLSRGLGFSREDRDANVRRIGFVASEVARHGGLVICAAVSPYRATRDLVRSMFEADRFVEVFVDTPLEVCESRDAKGMYAKARRGEIQHFTGVDDPYEPPPAAEVTLETVQSTPLDNARRVLAHLLKAGFVRPHEDGA